jgi:hypothetical protein
MKRREIAGLAGTAAWPIVARAQHMGMRVIGYLNASSPRLIRDLGRVLWRTFRERSGIW